jgi:hypothetical protein
MYAMPSYSATMPERVALMLKPYAEERKQAALQIKGEGAFARLRTAPS